MGAKTSKNTGIMVHLIRETIKAIIRCHTSRNSCHMVQVQGHI